MYLIRILKGMTSEEKLLIEHYIKVLSHGLSVIPRGLSQEGLNLLKNMPIPPIQHSGRVDVPKFDSRLLLKLYDENPFPLNGRSKEFDMLFDKLDTDITASEVYLSLKRMRGNNH